MNTDTDTSNVQTDDSKLLNIEELMNQSKEIYREYLKQRINTDYDKNKFFADMMRKYPELGREYPSIIRIAGSEHFDTKRLLFMLEMVNKITRKEITEHDASVAVGQELVDNIVKPRLRKDGKPC